MYSNDELAAKVAETKLKKYTSKRIYGLAARRRYSPRMEMLIEEGFDRAPEGECRAATGEAIYKDFTKLFSNELMKNITANGIVKKFYRLRSQAKEFDEGAEIYGVHKEYKAKPIEKSAPATIKELMLSAMQKSENMTINVQGENITVTFK